MTEALEGFDPQRTYDDASIDYDAAALDFWGYMALRTVDRLGLEPGGRVLDVPCGTGVALLALAERVGRTGHVVGVDYAERMADIARARARGAGARNVEIRIGDMTVLTIDEPYDAVQCALGLFFVDDMPSLVRTLLELVRPSGRLAVTVFGEHFFEPMRRVFIDAVAEVASGFTVVEPWKRTEDADVLREIFRKAGVEDVTIETEDEEVPLASADDWWRAVMGSGLRRSVAELGADAATRVRERCDAYVREHGVTRLLNRTHYAVAVR